VIAIGQALAVLHPRGEVELAAANSNVLLREEARLAALPAGVAGVPLGVIELRIIELCTIELRTIELVGELLDRLPPARQRWLRPRVGPAGLPASAHGRLPSRGASGHRQYDESD
jgi:hypothetical protein